MFPGGNRNLQIFFELGFFLIMVDLFVRLILQLLGGFGMFGQMDPVLYVYASPLLNMVGVALYLRYRMSRGIEYVRISFDHGWALPLGVGTLLGVAMTMAAASVGLLLGGAGPAGLPVVTDGRAFLLDLAATLLGPLLAMLAVEMVHRGVIANRVEEEFPYWKAIGFAMLFWVLSYAFGGMVRWMPLSDLVGNGLLYLFSVLLYWRTENLWWPVAVHFGHHLSLWVFFGRVSGLVSDWHVPPVQAFWGVWGLACGALLLMDWRDQQRDTGGGGRRRTFKTQGRMVRGPWGPH